jgi:hypothetical protein
MADLAEQAQKTAPFQKQDQTIFTATFAIKTI